jgi:hypothetical protein
MFNEQSSSQSKVQPKVEQPKVEQPKVEQPKVEQPKAVVAAKHYASPAFRDRWASEEAPNPMDSMEEWNRRQWEAWKATQIQHSGSYSNGSFSGKTSSK